MRNRRVSGRRLGRDEGLYQKVSLSSEAWVRRKIYLLLRRIARLHRLVLWCLRFVHRMNRESCLRCWNCREKRHRLLLLGHHLYV